MMYNLSNHGQVIILSNFLLVQKRKAFAWLLASHFQYCNLRPCPRSGFDQKFQNIKKEAMKLLLCIRTSKGPLETLIPWVTGLRHVLSSCRMLSKFLVRFSKWLQSVKKGVIDLFLCIAMAYNVFPCTETIRNTQTEKIVVFTM